MRHKGLPDIDSQPGRGPLRVFAECVTLMLAALLLLACGPGESRDRSGGRGTLSGSGSPTDPIVVAERWVSAREPRADMDSPAVWHGDNGVVRVIVTAKGTHDLWVFDGATGGLVGRFGERGGGPGEFLRPNGIAVLEDLLFVVERDNHRVQVLTLPDLRTVGFVGTRELISPCGIAVFGSEEGFLELFVTDNYQGSPASALDPGFLTRRVKHFRARLEGDRLGWELVTAFGDASGPGALRVVETIGVDRESGHLLIADEEALALKVYGLDGAFAGTTVAAGLYRRDPEGISLYACGSGGYWVLTDQVPSRTIFHVVDRLTFRHLGSFSGRSTAATDGIALTPYPVGEMSEGALFALDSNGGVSAFALHDVVTALGLEEACPQVPEASTGVPTEG